MQFILFISRFTLVYNMKTFIQTFLVLIFAGWQFCSFGQQLIFTPAESEAIHDSIRKSRWDVGGRLSHYSFRYMSEFFPVAMIHKAAVPYQFQLAPKKSIDNILIKSKKDTLSFASYLNKLHIASFIVVQKGKIVYEKYFSMLPEEQHSLQSVTKVITASLVTRLINERRINRDESIEKYIPELKGSDWQGITVKDILNMRSGMDSASIDFETGPFSNPQHRNYQLESALGLLPVAANTPGSVYKFIRELKKEKAPGIDAEYSNINTFVLGWLVEKVTNKKYADLVTELIWKPMGASSDAYSCLSDRGIAWPHGGISATLRDLARFGMLFTKPGIVSKKESIITFAQLKEIFDAPSIVNPMGPFKWAYQWDLASDGLMMKGGFGGQALFVHPEKEIVIAYFNYSDKDWSIDNNLSKRALDEIFKALAD